ncbi:MAG: glycosyltransferase [Prevotella sp.]|nr:glycosyltransferase [Prevotella sp.]
MNTERKYTIIVVTRNNAQGLERTLHSIRSLQYSQKETVVIDGASTDNTNDIITNYEDVITTFVSEKDSGIYNAMNKGIRYVNGDYVVFMNAGDIFAHENVLSTVNAYDGDIILGSESYGGKLRIVKKEMTLYDLLSVGINHQAVYYRKEVLQKYGFDESYALTADLKSVIEPLTKDHIKLAFVTDILAICEGGGASKVRWRETLTENNCMVDELIDPFYKDDYLRFARINNDMLEHFIVLSHFRSLFPLLKLLSKLARFINDKFKHIPLNNH